MNKFYDGLSAVEQALFHKREVLFRNNQISYGQAICISAPGFVPSQWFLDV